MSESFRLAIRSNFIFTASSFLGIFPFRIRDNELKIDKLLVLYSLVVTAIVTISYSIVSGHKVHELIIIEDEEEWFISFISASFYASHSLTFLSQIFGLCRHRNLLIKSVHTLDGLGNKFLKMNLKINKRAAIRKMYYLEMVTPFVCGVAFYLGGNTMGRINVGLCYSAMLLGTAFTCSQFTTFVDTVTDFIDSSSKFLMCVKHPVSFKKLLTVEKLVDAVSELFMTSAEINSIYALQMLITVLTSYISIISHLYFIFHNAGSKADWKHLHVPGDSVMLFYRFFIVWRLAYSSTSAYHKSKEFNTLLYQLMIEDTTNELIDNDKLKLHISMKREIVFSACGFFNLDFTLLHSMLASATTYLVILIQFSDQADLASESRRPAVADPTPSPLPASFTT